MKILIVDDSYDWLNQHKAALNLIFGESPFSVETALSASEGFNKALNSDFDLIVTDMEMETVFDGEYAGEWLLKNLVNHEKMKDTKFLIVSGAYNIDEIAQKFDVDYLPKNLMVQDFLCYKFKLQEMGIAI